MAVCVDVEAASAEEAERIASNFPLAELPDSCAEAVDDRWAPVGGLDGELDPTTIESHELD